MLCVRSSGISDVFSSQKNGPAFSISLPFSACARIDFILFGCEIHTVGHDVNQHHKSCVGDSDVHVNRSTEQRRKTAIRPILQSHTESSEWSTPSEHLNRYRFYNNDANQTH